MTGKKDCEALRAKVEHLLRACQQSTKATDLVDNCEHLFRFLRDKKLEYRLPFFFGASGTDLRSAEGHGAALNRLLTHGFENFIRILFELLDYNELSIQKVAVTFLLRVVRHEAQVHSTLHSNGRGLFPLSTFQAVLSRILQKQEFSSGFQDFLVSEFLGKYADLRYYSLKVVQKILREFAARKSDGRQEKGEVNIEEEGPPLYHSHECDRKGSESCYTIADDFVSEGEESKQWYYWHGGECELSRRVTSLLLKYPQPNKRPCSKGGRKRRRNVEEAAGSFGNSDDDGVIDRSLVPGGVDSNDDTVESVCCYIKTLNHSKALEAGSYRLVYQNTWLQLLLDVAHDTVTMQLLLEKVPKTVMPHISNPLLLAEFFLNSFNDETKLSLAILALSGMFFLVVKHRLGDPDLPHNEDDIKKDSTFLTAGGATSACVHFYQRLYRLITPGSFSPKLRVRFLRLLNLALRSDLLPTSLVASFIKKCCRVACLVSPAASLSLTVLVYSLLEKYYSTCKALINLPDHVASRLRVEGDAFAYDHVRGRPSEQSENEGSVQSSLSDDAQCFKWDPMCALVNESTPESLKVTKEELSPLIIKEAKMSLWEVDLLLRHAVAAVRQISHMFESDMSKPSARKANVDDFLDMSTGALLSQETKYMIKLSGSFSVSHETQTETPVAMELYDSFRSIVTP